MARAGRETVLSSQKFRRLSLLFLLVAGLGDMATTAYGLSAGFKETRALSAQACFRLLAFFSDDAL